MQFGRCRECLEFRYLAGGEYCLEHAPWEAVNLGIETRYGACDPLAVSTIGDLIVAEPRLNSAAAEYDVWLVITEMELVVEDGGRDPLQAFSYDEYQPAPIEGAATDAVEWIAGEFAV
jgi:hypothetical protein